MKKALACVALMALAHPAAAQTPTVTTTAATDASAGTTLKELLAGSAHPLTIKLRDMKPEQWRRFTLAGETDGGGFSPLLLIFGMMGGGAAAPPSAEAVYYTQAQTVAIGGETYLIAYRPLLKQPDIMALMLQSQRNGNAQPAPEQIIPEKLTLDSSVSLSLLNVKKIGGMADIRPFDAAKEIAEHQAADKALLDMLQANAAQNNPSGPTEQPAQPLVAPKVRAALAADKTLKADGNSIAVEEGENLITLRGVVVSAKAKEYAGHVARKYLKDSGVGFKVDNQLQVLDADVVKAINAPNARRGAKTEQNGAKKK